MKATNIKEAIAIWLGITLLILTLFFPPYGYNKTRTDVYLLANAELYTTNTVEVVPFTYIRHQFIFAKPSDSLLNRITISSGFVVDTSATNIHIALHILIIEAVIIILLIGGIIFTLRLRRKSWRPRIVLVDDDLAQLEMIELAIRGWFKEVILLKFQDGDAAWQELSRTDPDFLITDWNHIGMGTSEMLALLAVRKKRYPILVASGFAQEEHLREYTQQKLNITLFPKPFAIEQFNQELLTHVGAKNKL